MSRSIYILDILFHSRRQYVDEWQTRFSRKRIQREIKCFQVLLHAAEIVNRENKRNILWIKRSYSWEVLLHAAEIVNRENKRNTFWIKRSYSWEEAQEEQTFNRKIND